MAKTNVEFVQKLIKIRVPSDRAAKARKEYGDIAEVIPCDLYGKKITHSKKNNLQDIINDINQVNGLD
jgi:hypothetical protein